MIVTTKKQEQYKGKRGILLNTQRFFFAKYDDLNNGGSLNGSNYGTTVGGAQ